jgi:hypothetical protein
MQGTVPSMDNSKITVQQIDDRISQLERYIVQLRTMRNARILVSRLPPELLLSILRRVDCKDMLSMHATCKRIRAMMSAAPVLWAYINTTNGPTFSSRVFNLFARRAGNTLLKITTTPEFEHNQDWVAVIISNMARIEKIDAFPPQTPTSENLLRQFLTTPAHSLRHLSLQASYHTPNTLFFSPLMFCGICPRLEDLTLTHVRLMGLPRCLNLASLNLSQVRTTLLGLRSTLQAAPNIRNLSLNCSFPPIDLLSNLSPISLPFLESLSINDLSLRDIYRVLSIVPSPTRVLQINAEDYICGDGQPPNDHFADSIVARLATFWTIQTGNEQLPAASLEVDIDCVEPCLYPSEKYALKLHAQCARVGRNHTEISFRCDPWMASEFVPICRLVHTLRLRIAGCPDTEEFLGIGILDLESYSAIQHVHVSVTSMPVKWYRLTIFQELMDWLSQRKDKGSIVKTVVFTSCLDEIRPFVDYIRLQNLAEAVDWQE